jgi:hypothetical protein
MRRAPPDGYVEPVSMATLLAGPTAPMLPRFNSQTPSDSVLDMAVKGNPGRLASNIKSQSCSVIATASKPFSLA